MTIVTASMVAALRAKTDAPYLDCKKALVEAEGEASKAEAILRARLGQKASRAATRATTEGLVCSHLEEGCGVLIEINCETDFVAKNEAFIAFGQNVAAVIARQAPKDVEQLASLPWVDNQQTVEEARMALVGTLGENLRLRRFVRYSTTAKLSSYLHGTRIGVLVEYEGGDEQLGRDLAMHIAAMQPVALTVADVVPELIEQERAVALQKAKESGKPEAIVEKIVQGSVEKFLQQVVLPDQFFVRDDKKKVSEVLRAAGASVKAFTLYVVGEGLVKKTEDFATAVAEQVEASRKASV